MNSKTQSPYSNGSIGLCFRVKYLEELEDEPMETVEEQLLPDLIYLLDHNHETTNQNFGKRLSMLSYLNELEKKPNQYWISFMQSFFLDSPSIEVIMKPSVELSKQINSKKEKEFSQRVKQLGKKKKGKNGC